MKRLLKVMAFMALLNMFALGGVLGYACKQGWIEPRRVQEAFAVLKGEDREKTVETTDGEEKKPQPGVQVSERLRRNAESEEQYRIEFARREREIQDGWAQLEAQQLMLLRAKDEFEAEKKRYEAQREALARKEGDSGLQKELLTLSGIPPKNAKELLKAKEDADVVRIFMAMDQRKLNKIVKQCKSSEDRLWIGRIMEKLK
ncbi:MAG: hypothetical protein ACE5EC_03525 [Phycisphaerae bacterium]